VRQIVDAHGGAIHVQNRIAPGSDKVLGARFVVRLPAK
jgi:signal transduction histidine kinase